MEELSRETFSEQLNTPFYFHHEQFGRVETRLTEAVDGKAYPNEKTTGRVSFSLLFKGPIRQPLEQKIYPVEHERMGRFDLFIIPIGMNHETITYEAIFNRFLPPPGSGG